MPRASIWNDETLATLRRLYPTTPASDIADMIGCTGASVLNKAHELGLKKDPSFRVINYYGRYTGKRDPNKRVDQDPASYERDRDRKKEYQRQYNLRNREKRRKQARLYYQEHRDEIIERSKKRHQKLKSEIYGRE